MNQMVYWSSFYRGGCFLGKTIHIRSALNANHALEQLSRTILRLREKYSRAGEITDPGSVLTGIAEISEPIQFSPPNNTSSSQSFPDQGKFP